MTSYESTVDMTNGESNMEGDHAIDVDSVPKVRSPSHLSIVIDNEDLSDYGALPKLPRVSEKRGSKNLEWKNLKVTVPGKWKAPPKEILRGVSGIVRPGEFVAIMGPSGAGKTTLLNTLAGRNAGIEVSGEILLDSQEMGLKDMRSESAYVMQEDALFATATVRESLEFSAALRLKAELEKEDRMEIVEKMIRAMGLTKAADTMVGNVTIKGVSGGEKKRTAIGIELLSDPNIIFLDEPTSGLDSFAAFKVVSLLRTLCATGCMVITTIHQPSSEVFSLFDRAYLLADGLTVYDGTIAKIPQFFGGCLSKPCPENFNPADHIMFVMQLAGKTKLREFNEIWLKNASDYQDEAVALLANKEKMDVSGEATKLHEQRPVLSQFLLEMKFLGLRELRNFVRDKVSLLAAVGTTVFINLIVGAIFNNQGDWGPGPYRDIDLTSYNYTREEFLNQSIAKSFSALDTTIYNNNVDAFNEQLLAHFGALTLIAIGGLFGLAQPMILSFPLERPIFLREYANRSYTWASYFLSKLPKELMLSLLQSGILVLVSYFLIGFKGNFLFIWLSICLLGLSVSSCAMLLGAVSENVQVAVQLSPLILVPQLLFSGFQLPIERIPEWLRWAQYLCSLKYGINLFNIVEFDQPTSEYLPESRPQIDRFLDSQETDPELWWLYLMVLMFIFLGFRLVAMVALALKAL